MVVFHGIYWDLPNLVICYIAIEHHHFHGENSQFRLGHFQSRTVTNYRRDKGNHLQMAVLFRWVSESWCFARINPWICLGRWRAVYHIVQCCGCFHGKDDDIHIHRIKSAECPAQLAAKVWSRLDCSGVRGWKMGSLFDDSHRSMGNLWEIFR